MKKKVKRKTTKKKVKKKAKTSLNINTIHKSYSSLQKLFSKTQSNAKKLNDKNSLKKLTSYNKSLSKKVKDSQKNPSKTKYLSKEISKGKTLLKNINKKLKSLQNKHSKTSSSKQKSHPKSESDRVSTDVPNFDKLIEGGFKKNTTNLLVGASGSGKSIFAIQFLLAGLKKGENCLFVTFEEKKNKFYKNMLRFGWNLEDYEKRGLFTFLEYTPIKVKTMLEEGGGAIESLILKKKMPRLVIDSITSFALLFNNELEKREAALNLFNMISKWNCTSLLTLEGKPSRDDESTTQTLEFESDSILLFYYPRSRGERHRYLEILKMRGTKHSKKTYNFHINENGIEINPKPVSGIPS